MRDDGDRRNLRHLIAHFNLPGAHELYEALEPPEKGRKLPDCGCEPVHPARSLPSKGNFDDLHYLLQVNQARALTLGVEWFRSRQPRCMGTLYWQLNDCWPGATSWSCIDGDGRKKPLWYATRRFFGGVVATFQPDPDGTLWLYLINDTDEPFSKRAIYYRSYIDGEVPSVGPREPLQRMNVPPRSVGRIQVDPRIATPADPTREMLWVSLHDVTAHWFFAPDKLIRYPRPAFTAEWSDGKLTIVPKTFMRDVCVFVDRLDPDATISDQMVTPDSMVPFTFEIQSKLPLTLEQLTAPPVFQCVNRFGAGQTAL